MRLSSRRSDDADVIRARLRALLDADGRPAGWVPADAAGEPASPATSGDGDEGGTPSGGEGSPEELPGGIGRHRAPGTAVRVDPGRAGARSLWAVGLLAALLLVGWTWLDRPAVEPAPLAPAGSAAHPAGGTADPAAASTEPPAERPATVVVSVVGLVARPGLVDLPEGARVADAITAAGGLLPDADPASVNLAAVVADGQQIAVGVPGAAGSPPAGSGPGSGPLDLNRATAAELDALPGIGPVLAQRIVDHRERHGRFTTVEQLDDVPGIGPSTYADLAGQVTV